MNPETISTRIRQGIELRRQRAREILERRSPLLAAADGSAGTVRESPRLAPPAFREAWEARLLPAREGMVSPASLAAPGEAPVDLDGAPEDRQNEESWASLAQAVHALREEWDRQGFEGVFGRGGSGEGAPPGSTPLEIQAPAPTGPATEIEREPRGVQGGERQGEAAPPAETGLAGECPRTHRAAAPAASDPHFPDGSPDGLAPLEGEGGSSESPPEELNQKLDELIRLVKNSIEARNPKAGAAIPGLVTREIAREIAGQLRDTIQGFRISPPAPAEKGAAPSPAAAAAGDAERAPPARARISIDDIGSIIDQITGSREPS